MLLVNKVDLVTTAQLGAVEALLRRVNPTAELVRTERSWLDPGLLLGHAPRFKLAQAEAHPEWLKEARAHEHTPETVEYGISSFLFRAERPFHPTRLHAALGTRPRPGALAQLLRLKGVLWLATQHHTQAHAALAGTQFALSPGPPWDAHDACPDDACPDGTCPLDTGGGGSCSGGEEGRAARHTELVCIGQALDHAAAAAALDACLLTEGEMALGEHGWAAYADPFRAAWDREAAGHVHTHGQTDGHAHDHAHADANEHGHVHDEFCQHADGDCDDGARARSHQHDHA